MIVPISYGQGRNSDRGSGGKDGEAKSDEAGADDGFHGGLEVWSLRSLGSWVCAETFVCILQQERVSSYAFVGTKLRIFR